MDVRQWRRIILRGYACGDTPRDQALVALRRACPGTPDEALERDLNKLERVRHLVCSLTNPIDSDWS